MKRVLAVAVLATWSGSSAAAAQASQYVQSCREILNRVEGSPVPRPTETFSHGECMGVTETVLALSSLMSMCIPPNVTIGQAVQVVVHYMEAHPEKLHLELPVVALAALQDVWMCKKGGGQ